MADDLTARNPFIDLTGTGARVIRAAGTARVRAIRVNGTAGGGQGDIIIRENSSSGPIIFFLIAGSSTVHDGTISFPGSGRNFNGLFMDTQGTAWATSSHIIVYTGESKP